MTSNTNTHANLINNATNMQSHLLEFSHQMSNLSLKSLEDQSGFKVTSIEVQSYQNLPAIKITFDSDAGSSHFIRLGSNGVPSHYGNLDSNSGTFTSATAINTANANTSKAQASIAMAVVATHLKGIGLTDDNIKSIFENGITPTSLAAAESQLKGHHDSVLQLSLEALSRVTSVLQKISQKLSQ
jgi:hypothetical protein